MHASKFGKAASKKKVDNLNLRFMDSLPSVAISTRLESGPLKAPEQRAANSMAANPTYPDNFIAMEISQATTDIAAMTPSIKSPTQSAFFILASVSYQSKFYIILTQPSEHSHQTWLKKRRIVPKRHKNTGPRPVFLSFRDRKPEL